MTLSNHDIESIIQDQNTEIQRTKQRTSRLERLVLSLYRSRRRGEEGQFRREDIEGLARSVEQEASGEGH